MIKTFANKRTKKLYRNGQSRRFPPDITRRAIRKLDQLHAAYATEDLESPPSTQLHTLVGNRAGQYSISVNAPWRICFRFHDGDAYDVEVCDDHQERGVK